MASKTYKIIIMLPEWNLRPITVAHLLNPAFCGEILRRCAYHFQKTEDKNNSLPFQLTFVILPLILHKEIREALPLKSNKNFITWIEENQSIKMMLPGLIKSTVPFTKEAIQFLMMYEIIKINELGAIEVIVNSPQKTISESEVTECYKKAELVGKWLAKSGSSQSIFINLGIKP
jgi:hypothetical protein